MKITLKLYRDEPSLLFKIGCHVSAAGGVFNAPKNASELACETFQIFTRPPMGGAAPKLTDDIIAQFKEEMEKYYPSAPTTPSASQPPLLEKQGNTAAPRSLYSFSGRSPREAGEVVGGTFVVHCPYFVNFGSGKKPTFHGSISVVAEELKRSNLIGAKYVMTHLGSFKDLGPAEGMKQAKVGLKSVLEKYEGNTQFLLEIAAGAGEVIGKTFEELVELMEPLVKFKTFGGICFDTQHAFSAGYDIRTPEAVKTTFQKFDKVIGLKWLKMSHINDSKTDLAGRKDRHDHIGQGKIGENGFLALLEYWHSKKLDMPLIFETEHDKVEEDIEILKKLRNKI